MEDHTRSGKPLFSIDLGGNGGMLEPVDYDELQDWLKKEIDFWEALEIDRASGGISGIVEKVSNLRKSFSMARYAAHLEKESSLRRNILGMREDEITEIPLLIEQIYLPGSGKKALPHSASAKAKAIDRIREEYGMDSARYFSALQVPSEHSSLYPKSIEEWYGVFAGLMFIDAKSKVADLSVGANQLALDALRGNVTQLFEGNAQRLARMQRDHQSWIERSQTLLDESTASFESSQMIRDQQHAAMISTHEGKMAHIREIFRNEFALHAPAEYWNKKSLVHRRATLFLGALSFVSIFASAWFVGTNVHDILSNTERGAFPETWRLGLLAVLGVFSVWAVRLIVRMFLSHLHLAGDAEERVVMLKTYLSLMQDGKTNSTEDRQLILQALFRPASDGIVKDEGVPTSVFELLTRTSK